jgi:hypothetical protein
MSKHLESLITFFNSCALRSLLVSGNASSAWRRSWTCTRSRFRRSCFAILLIIMNRSKDGSQGRNPLEIILRGVRLRLTRPGRMFIF